ncbi:MAG: HAMP domain-containing sensor histidine kinase [Gemmatimonadetes bacterium]|nr:HAMP domain-containing sensor histidine kinase [Gemmatimonadota bacterium]
MGNGDIAIGIAIGIALGVVLAVLAYSLGRSGARADGRAESARQIKAATDAIANGLRPEGGKPGSAEAELCAALEKGWAPIDSERQAALREAVGKVSGFLHSRVRVPLAAAEGATSIDDLRERVGTALGALGDLDFFLETPPSEKQGTDLVELVKQVANEFSGDQGVGLRLKLPSAPVRASINAGVLMDGVYLILHNTQRFARGTTVDVTVQAIGSRATIAVRDRGEGFPKEAFKRAFDPFYSTSDEGLGLGLPHARTLVEGMGGQIELRNVPGGGAEVQLSFDSI